MTTLWDIKMKLMGNGHYQATIVDSVGHRVIGTGSTPFFAYRHAEIQLVIKPALEWLNPDKE